MKKCWLNEVWTQGNARNRGKKLIHVFSMKSFWPAPISRIDDWKDNGRPWQQQQNRRNGHLMTTCEHNRRVKQDNVLALRFHILFHRLSLSFLFCNKKIECVWSESRTECIINDDTQHCSGKCGAMRCSAGQCVTYVMNDLRCLNVRYGSDASMPYNKLCFNCRDETGDDNILFKRNYESRYRSSIALTIARRRKTGRTFGMMFCLVLCCFVPSVRMHFGRNAWEKCEIK